MNKLLLCLIMITISYTASSQRVYFVYLQTEQEQPFFVRMDEKVYSSTASGYLILSRLRDSVYQFTVGFPQGRYPEQKFAVTIKAKDHGFLLKNFGEKGWGLFDLQTMSVQMAIPSQREGVIRTEKKEVTAFTEILARAADDSTLKERPIFAVKEEEKPAAPVVETKTTAEVKIEEIKKEEVKKDDLKPPVSAPVLVKNEDPVSINSPNPPVKSPELIEVVKTKQEESKTEIKEPQATTEAAIKTETPVEYEKTVVRKASQSVTDEGLGITFIDEANDGTKDTVSILIPHPRPVKEIASETPKDERKFLDILPDTAVIKTELPVQAKPAQPEEKPVAVKTVFKNNCKDFANESDFLKLRKNMAGEGDDDDMVDEARKYFKTKCFSTMQVKNLGVLFLDDLGKYKFFDMSYTFVSDPENFPSLQSELKSDYYINRFKAMLK